MVLHSVEVQEVALASLEEDSRREFSPYLRSAGTWKFIQSDFGKGLSKQAFFDKAAEASHGRAP